ncbi:hypothetical protein EDD18DRAFT_1105469 [Armillaria luteobubalina]|uniref:Uncharacterized protein n=1 Tax=Armillaria luteobubalina TaxID=153913 RepID=A0AA39UP20_9AGAR|nr:hypothetical protein EDD18DRAFT_1105469 [Armillaria luteobubalina]
MGRQLMTLPGCCLSVIPGLESSLLSGVAKVVVEGTSKGAMLATGIAFGYQLLTIMERIVRHSSQQNVQTNPGGWVGEGRKTVYNGVHGQDASKMQRSMSGHDSGSGWCRNKGKREGGHSLGTEGALTGSGAWRDEQGGRQWRRRAGHLLPSAKNLDKKRGYLS